MKGADSGDKVRHNERNDRLFLERMLVFYVIASSTLFILAESLEIVIISRFQSSIRRKFLED